MTTTFAFLGQFGDAIEFIFQERESVGGGVMVGGLSEIGGFAKTHLLVSFVAMAVACLIAIPTGLYLGHKGKGEFLAISVSNVGRAVPAVVLLFFFIAYVGNGFSNVAFVLFLLAVPPILTNTYVGVRQVSPELVDAARGMGMTDAGIMRRVELPLAIPTVFAGIRVATVNVIATATIAPLGSVDSLGTPIISENVYGADGRLGAAIAVTVLTLAISASLAALQRAATPRGLKLGAHTPGRRRLLPSLRRRTQTAP